MPERQIVALGGGGFSMEPDNPLLDDYILRTRSTISSPDSLASSPWMYPMDV